MTNGPQERPDPTTGHAEAATHPEMDRTRCTGSGKWQS